MALIVLEEPQLFQIIRDDFPAVKTIFRNIKRGKTQSSVKKKWEIEKGIKKCTIFLKLQQNTNRLCETLQMYCKNVVLEARCCKKSINIDILLHCVVLMVGGCASCILCILCLDPVFTLSVHQIYACISLVQMIG